MGTGTSQSSRTALVVPVPALILFVCVLLTGLQPIRSADFWHHVASGRLVWENGWPAKTDPFSHTAQGKQWVQFEWLAQLLIFLGYTRLGAAGIILIKATVIAGGYLLLWFVCAYRGGTTVAAAVAMVAAVTLIPRSYERPEFFSWLLLGGFMFLLELGRTRHSRLLWFLPAIMVAWVNTHAMYVAGLGLLGIVCCGEAIESLRDRTNIERRRGAIKLVSVLVLCAAATLGNPYGVRMLGVPLHLVGSSEIPNVIAEWSGSSLSALANPYFLGLWILCIVTVAAWYKLDITDMLVLCCFGTLAFRANRHIPLFAFVCAPIFAKCLSAFASTVPMPRRMKEGVVPLFCVALLLPALTYLGLGAPRLSRFGLGVMRERYPEKAAQFLEGNAIRGNLFNTYHFGNYLLWRLCPADLVFIDGRVDMYGDDVLREYGRIRRGEDDWGSALDARHVTAAVLEIPHGKSVADPIVSKLFESADWRLAHWDDLTFVFVRSSAYPETAAIPKFTIRPDTFDCQKAAEQELERAMAEFRLTLSHDPDCVLARARLAECYQRLELYPAAIVQWRKVIEHRPSDGRSRFNLALCLAHIREYAESETLLRQAIGQDGPRADALRILGNIRYEQGDYSGAAGYFRKALLQAPEDARPRWSLIAAYEKLGRTSDAIKELQALLKIVPSFPGAREKLNTLVKQQEQTRERR